MSGHLKCSENFAYSGYFGRNSDKLTTYRTRKLNFSGPSNNSLSSSEVKPSILKNPYSTTLSLYTTETKLENFAYSAYFGRNSDKLTTFRTGKLNFSGASNNGFSCFEVKPSILKSAYSTTLSLFTIETKQQQVKAFYKRSCS